MKEVLEMAVQYSPGYLIKVLRLHHGFSQGRLAQPIGVTRGSIALIESPSSPRGVSPRLVRATFAICPFPRVSSVDDATRIVEDLVVAVGGHAGPAADRWREACTITADPQPVVSGFELQLPDEALGANGIVPDYAAAIWWWAKELASLRAIADPVNHVSDLLAAWPETGEALPENFAGTEPSNRRVNAARAPSLSLTTATGEAGSLNAAAAALTILAALPVTDRELWLAVGRRLAHVDPQGDD